MGDGSEYLAVQYPQVGGQICIFMLMADHIEFRTLRGVDENELLRVFNQSFADYFVTVQLTFDQLRQKIKADHVDLDLSVGAFADNTLVGFIHHAFNCIDGVNTVYNGGTGVFPAFRCQAESTAPMHL